MVRRASCGATGQPGHSGAQRAAHLGGLPHRRAVAVLVRHLHLDPLAQLRQHLELLLALGSRRRLRRARRALRALGHGARQEHDRARLELPAGLHVGERVPIEREQLLELAPMLLRHAARRVVLARHMRLGQQQRRQLAELGRGRQAVHMRVEVHQRGHRQAEAPRNPAHRLVLLRQVPRAARPRLLRLLLLLPHVLDLHLLGARRAHGRQRPGALLEDGLHGVAHRKRV